MVGVVVVMLLLKLARVVMGMVLTVVGEGNGCMNSGDGCPGGDGNALPPKKIPITTEDLFTFLIISKDTSQTNHVNNLEKNIAVAEKNVR